MKLVETCILDIDQSYLLERKISTWLGINCARVLLVFIFGLNLHLFIHTYKVRIQKRQCLWKKPKAFLYHQLYFFDMGIFDPVPVMADDITAIAPP